MVKSAMLKLATTTQNFYLARHLHSSLKRHVPHSKYWWANRTLSREMSSLKVRLVHDKENDRKSNLLNLLSHDRWRPCLGDVNSLTSPPSLFVGELEGKAIGFVAVLKYDPNYWHMGFYMIEKQYREKGYGTELYKAALEGMTPSQNITAYANHEDMLKTYIRSGLHPHWTAARYDVHLETAFQNLSRIPPTSNFYQAQRIDEVDRQALFNYDGSVFGYQRNKFLQTFLHAQGSHARVVINKDGAIVGYAVARVCVIKEEGYRLGPLYADSLEIAQVLLKALFEDMLEMRMSSSSSILIQMPESQNPEATKLAEILNGKYLFNATFMSTKGIPKGRFEKWFALISGSLG